MVHCPKGARFQHFDREARNRSHRRHVNVVRAPLAFLIGNFFISLSGAWKSAQFKKYNFETEGIYPNGGALHPLLKVREEMRNIFLEMGSVSTEPSNPCSG